MVWCELMWLHEDIILLAHLRTKSACIAVVIVLHRKLKFNSAESISELFLYFSQIQDKSLGERILNSGILGSSVANLSISGLQKDVLITLRNIKPIPVKINNINITQKYWNNNLTNTIAASQFRGILPRLYLLWPTNASFFESIPRFIAHQIAQNYIKCQITLLNVRKFNNINV